MYAQKGQTSLRSIEGRKVSVALRDGTRPRRLRPCFQWSQPTGQPVALRERRRSVRRAQRRHRRVHERRRPAVGGLTDTPAGMATVGPAPDEIAASRARVRRLGLRNDDVAPPYRPAVDAQSRLAQLARPVLDRLGDDLLDAPISVVLADRDGWIIDRRGEAGTLQSTLDRARFMTGRQWDEFHTGTNAVGTALVASSPVIVRGPEHVADSLAWVTSAASPIVDPRTGQLLGVLALVCAIEDSNVLMLPYACRVEPRDREPTRRRGVTRGACAEGALRSHTPRARGARWCLSALAPC